MKHTVLQSAVSQSIAETLPVMILVRRSCSCHLRPGGAREICTNKVQMDYMSRIHKIHIHQAVNPTDQPDRRLRTVPQHLYFLGPFRQRHSQLSCLVERTDRPSDLLLFPERNTHIIPILWRQIIHRNCFKKNPLKTIAVKNNHSSGDYHIKISVLYQS